MEPNHRLKYFSLGQEHRFTSRINVRGDTLLSTILLLFVFITTHCILLIYADEAGEVEDKCMCPMNVSSSMRTKDQLDGLFRGLFYSESDIDDLFHQGYQVESWINVSTLDKPVRCLGQSCGITRPYNRNVGRRRMATAGCCDSSEFIIQPLTVIRTEKQYQVVHLPKAPQLISTSACKSANKSCNAGGHCTEIWGYTWILIYDVEVSYHPPVKFVPIQFPSGCVCIL